ncbi:MAG: hypothetical protein ACI4F4_06410 [Lachnospiraceae bacterium]
MKKLMDRMKKIQNNQGNSFVVVVATVSFLAILTAALLVAVALIYRLKAYDINTKDNFYYLEQAMDEIYAGVGADSLQILNEAYDDTLETLVYYDTLKKEYVTMSNEQANEMLDKTYMYMLQHDERYDSQTHIETRLRSFITNLYDASSNPEGVQLTFDSIKMNEKDITIVNLVLKREAEYSTVNTRSKKDSVDGTVPAGDTFIQTISTDFVIGTPKLMVNFNLDRSQGNELYEYSMIADCGIEITGADGKSARGNDVHILGNVYAASDFYNKYYNENPGKIHTENNVALSTVEREQFQKINSYSKDRLLECNGVNVKSMYSGIYIDGADVSISADRLIVPGTLAVMNCSETNVTTISNGSNTYADVWADSIVLDGYALKKNLEGDLKGSSLQMRANIFMYDDLEVNANASKVKLYGEYYGYNYASTDNRTYSEHALDNGTRTFTANTNTAYKNGKAIKGQAHYNSSAIILNGDDAELDFSDVNSMYVAGQSYIELSKQTTTTEEAIEYTVESTLVNDTVKLEAYDYAAVDKDNYTKTRSTTAGIMTQTVTPIQDYRTGEAVSVKSNQLAYIPNTNVVEDATGIYVSLPASVRATEAFADVWDDLSKVPVIKTTISGKAYYFYDFSKAKQTAAMNEFIAKYAELFDVDTITSGDDDRTTGEKANLTNITDYEFFQVKALDVRTDDKTVPIYTNSAITTKVGTEFTIKASQKDMEALTNAANKLSASSVDTAAAGANASSLTSALNKQYKEVKWTLTNASKNGDYVNEAHALFEDDITPINHYFDFSLIDDHSGYYAMKSGYGVWVSDGDLHVGANGYSLSGGNNTSYKKAYKRGRVKGIIIAKGDVTFDTDVNSFEGLIVTGGKIIINNFATGKNKMELTANQEIIKSILKECDASRGESEDKNFGFVCDMFRLFVSSYRDPGQVTENDMYTDFSSLMVEDLITLKNWVKNVD